jgi:hypothetical protein
VVVIGLGKNLLFKSVLAHFAKVTEGSGKGQTTDGFNPS